MGGKCPQFRPGPVKAFAERNACRSAPLLTDRRQTTLPNGIVVLTDSVPHAETVHASVQVRVGSLHEPDEVSGISHLLEHVVFRGTLSTSGEELQARFGRIGAETNGCTTENATTFSARCVPDHLSDVLGWLGEMVREPALRAEDVVLEQQIVEQENCRGCFGCTMREALYSQAFPDQSARNPIIGYEDTVAALTAGDLAAWHERMYVGANITVAVFGRVKHEDVVARTQWALGMLPPGTAARYPVLRYEPGEIQIASSSSQGALWIALPLIGMDEREIRAVYSFQDLYSGHPGSSLMRELREKRGLVYHAGTSIEDLGPIPVMRFHLMGDAPRMGEIADIALSTLHALARDIPEQDYAITQSRMRSLMRMGLDDHGFRIDDMMSDIVQIGSLTDWEERLDGYASLTREDLQAAARRLLAREPAFVMQGPARSMPKFADLRSMWAGSAQAGRKRGGLFRLAG